MMISGMKTTWNYAVTEDGQISVDFVSTDDRSATATGGVTLTRANSLAIALGVLQRRPDVSIDAAERAPPDGAELDAWRSLAVLLDGRPHERATREDVERARARLRELGFNPWTGERDVVERRAR